MIGAQGTELILLEAHRDLGSLVEGPDVAARLAGKPAEISHWFRRIGR